MKLHPLAVVEVFHPVEDGLAGHEGAFHLEAAVFFEEHHHSGQNGHRGAPVDGQDIGYAIWASFFFPDLIVPDLSPQAGFTGGSREAYRACH